MRILDKQPEGGWLSREPGAELEGLKAPGHCLISHDIDGPLLDTDVYVDEIDPYGYIAVGVVEQMGKAVGMVPESEVKRLRADLKQAREESKFARARLQKLVRDAEAGLKPVA